MPPRKKPVTTAPLRRSKRIRQRSSFTCPCSCSNEDLKEPVPPKRKKLESSKKPTTPKKPSKKPTTPRKPVDAPAPPTLQNNNSSQYRIQGNAIYGRAFQDGIAPILKVSRLEEALRWYNRAVSAAEGPTKTIDMASALKNCGVVKRRIGEEGQKHQEEESKTLACFQEALRQMNRAIICGSEAHGKSWTMKLNEQMEEIYQEVSELVLDLPLKERLGELFRAVAFLPTGLKAATSRYEIADTLFKESVRFFEAGEFRQSLSCLHDVHQPVEEALSIIRGSSIPRRNCNTARELKSDLTVLKRDTTYHIAMAESLKTRRAGEELLTKILDNDEFLNMDLVWIALDNFKEASLQAAELDLEQEAAAQSYLGFMHYKLLFSRTRAKKYFKRCLELVEAAKPKTFNSEKWFTQCTQCFAAIQNLERSRDEEAQRKIRDKILEGMQKKMTAITKANSSASELLEHLYKHHAPPKECKFTPKHLEELKKNEGSQTEESQKARKKLLLKACVDFHPDKFRDKQGESKEDQEKRKVLSEEITKMITKYYEHLKFC